MRKGASDVLAAVGETVLGEAGKEKVIEAVLHSVVEGDRPDGSEIRILTAEDGVEIRVARWPASTRPTTRGTVFLLHGRSEFIEKYYEVVDELRARGWAVVTFDWRGQGLSARLLPDPQKGHVRDFTDYVSDAFLVYEQALVPDLPSPHVLLGHSMGGHCGLRFLQDFPGRMERGVLVAPMLGWNGIQGEAMQAMAAINCALGRGDTYTWLQGEPDPSVSVNTVTSDDARFARNEAFCENVPSLRLGGPTWRWAREAMRSIHRVWDRERLLRVKTPTLVASAERDRIVSSARHGSLPFLNPTFTLLSVESAEHEILQETDEVRSRFWATFDRFMT